MQYANKNIPLFKFSRLHLVNVRKTLSQISLAGTNFFLSIPLSPWT
jgi:hypothetical protein